MDYATFSHHMLSKCELLENWPLAAAYIKVDTNQLSSEACACIPGIAFPLFHDHWNGTHKNFTMCNSEHSAFREGARSRH